MTNLWLLPDTLNPIILSYLIPQSQEISRKELVNWRHIVIRIGRIGTALEHHIASSIRCSAHTGRVVAPRCHSHLNFKRVLSNDYFAYLAGNHKQKWFSWCTSSLFACWNIFFACLSNSFNLIYLLQSVSKFKGFHFLQVTSWRTCSNYFFPIFWWVCKFPWNKSKLCTALVSIRHWSTVGTAQGTVGIHLGSRNVTSQPQTSMWNDKMIHHVTKLKESTPGLAGFWPGPPSPPNCASARQLWSGTEQFTTASPT